ncbi:adenosine deaminase [Rhizobium leguminosarum]|uniref:adenosine deaminase n=1 Tax=Rhizobium leguminosarum TaxID=384 RepID=UPI001C973DFC|nr:adenosine deaminase [Rhizobium leguminosarum]MBY5601743.1 adenosine deaminase [Rhizobium leguminosarum]
MILLRGNRPTVDLHVHLRGTIDHASALSLAKKNKVHLARHYFKLGGGYVWEDFREFLTVYDQIGRVVQTAEDIYTLAMSYLLRCASEGTIYVEFMLSPGHSVLNGIPFEEQIKAMETAFSDARRDAGIEGGLVVTCVRHRGPDEAVAIAEQTVQNLSPAVVGFGLTGNETLFDATDFKGAFQIAGEAGLGLTAHTGEWCNATSVLHTVEELSLSRVGHGIRAMEDKAVLEKLVERNVGFEVCLSSNLALMPHGLEQEHPLAKMLAAGCKVSLSTDDPAFFDTTPNDEYSIAQKRFGLSDSQLLQISVHAIDMSFCGTETKSKLRRKIDEWRVLGTLK